MTMPSDGDAQPKRNPDRIRTGIAGLDDILGGGLTRNRLYLIEGTPGTGKTTLALQFLLEGARRGETGLYITLSETEEELHAVAASHNWSLDALSIFELIAEEGLDPEREQSLLHPSEIELGETIRDIRDRVERTQPARIVFDSLSEMRLLAQSPLRYRRQILALKHFFGNLQCTVLLLDDRTGEPRDLQLHSIAHGVVTLEQLAIGFGAERRRLRVVKMRATKFRGGYHDFILDTGGLSVFPRLVAAEHHGAFAADVFSTGVAELDALLGGGLMPGTNTLLIGPAGVGKTSTAVRCMLAALERGEKAVYFLFDEGLGTVLTRAANLGMDLRPHVAAERLVIRQVNPAELSPGEFTAKVRHSVEHENARVVMIDSLNGYLQAMPEEKFLVLQMHELLSYLNQQGVVTLMILGQHGLVGDIRTDVDLSYLADNILLLRFFEADGEVRKAIAGVKTRTSEHERTIREFRLGADGLRVGATLRGFEGILAGIPTYRGDTAPLPPSMTPTPTPIGTEEDA